MLISCHFFCRITNALDLKEHLQKTVKKLPAGIRRKVRLQTARVQPSAQHRAGECLTAPHVCVPQLCFALSMLGNPPVTLLDEPSTGMDPKAKQHMWWVWGGDAVTRVPVSYGYILIQSPARKEKLWLRVSRDPLKLNHIFHEVLTIHYVFWDQNENSVVWIVFTWFSSRLK